MMESTANARQSRFVQGHISDRWSWHRGLRCCGRDEGIRPL